MSECGRQLFYMAPMQNASLIGLLGILSYNRRLSMPALSGLSVSIADPFVNSRRHWRHVNGRSLHDFVPLYWSTHTPMQYVVTVKNRTLPQDDLVFFVLDADNVLALPGVITSDGNAASNETCFYEGDGALPHLDWRILNTPNCFSRDYKRRKCAEVLVPDCVPPERISHIAVRTHAVAATLLSTLTALGRELKKKKSTIELRAIANVRVCPEFYYS